MGGKLSLQSTPGVGSIFYVDLLKSDEEETVDKPTTDSRRLNRRVLLVDDEPMLREIMVHYLNELHCEVVEAGSGVEAMTEIKSSEFDIIITDIDNSSRRI